MPPGYWSRASEYSAGLYTEKHKQYYEKETFYGEMIKACTKINDEGGRIICTHKILDRGGNVLTVGETIWEK
jgi:hypothetical protein